MTENKDHKQEPKIIVDDDWKAQAQAEKERLAAEVKAAEPKPKADPSATAAPDAVTGSQPQADARQLPPADFMALVNSMAMQAVFAMGGVEDTKTKKRMVDPALARFHIDMLGVLQEKTKGNLSSDEDKMLEHIIGDLRMNFVQLTETLKKQAQQPAKPDQGKGE